jgi:hypothetical protein
LFIWGNQSENGFWFIFNGFRALLMRNMRIQAMDKNSTSSRKRVWVRPEVTRIEAGSAESLRGAKPDGGGGRQGS